MPAKSDSQLPQLTQAQLVPGTDLVAVTHGTPPNQTTSQMTVQAFLAACIQSASGSGPITVTASGTGILVALTGVVPVANGGTGSASQNFVDLSTAQVVAGSKQFSSPLQTVQGSQTQETFTIPTYTATGAAVANTMHAVKDSVTASGTSTTVARWNFTGAAAFASAGSYIVVVTDNATGAIATVTAQAAGSFTFTSTNTHVYTFFDVGT